MNDLTPAGASARRYVCLFFVMFSVSIFAAAATICALMWAVIK